VNSEKVTDVAFLLSVEKHLFYTQVQVHTKTTENIFFIHCESNGISSRFSVYLITEGVYHQPQAVLCFCNDDIQGFRLGDIQNYVFMIYTPSA